MMMKIVVYCLVLHLFVDADMALHPGQQFLSAGLNLKELAFNLKPEGILDSALSAQCLFRNAEVTDGGRTRLGF